MSQPRCRHSHHWISLLLFVLGPSLEAQSPPFQIIVHADNPMAEISVGSASRMFLGKITQWPGGGEITPLDLPPDAPTRVSFTHGVHGKSVAGIEKYWQRMVFSGRGVPPEVLQSPRAVVEAVRTLPGAIAYTRAGIPLPAGVKRLQIIEDNQPSQPIAENSQPSRPSESTLPPNGPTRPSTSLHSREQGKATHSTPEGMLLALEVSPSSLYRVWASFHSRGLWTSSDGGLTWTPTPTSPDPSLRALAFDPSDPQFLLVGGESGLYRSLDLGNQWQASLLQADREVDLQGIQRIALLPQSPGTFIVHTSTALLRSDDRGETFYKLQLPGWPQAFTMDASNETLWIFANGSFHLSVDRGASWGRHFHFPENPPVTQILIAELFGEKTLWIATDGGLLHGQIDSTGQLVGTLKRSSLQEVSVQRLAAIENTIYAMTQRGVFRLADDGQTWERIAEVQGALLAADPFNFGRLYAGSSQGRLWKREHPAAPWQHVFYINNPRPSSTTFTTLRKPPPPPPPSPIPLRLRCRSEAGHVGALAVHPNKLGVLWAGSEHGVFRSEDGGASWGPPGWGLLISDVHSLTVDPQTPTTLWAGTHGGGVHVSHDSGATWAPTPSLALTAVHDVMVDPLVPELLYTATSEGVFVSPDRGAHWRQPMALDEKGHKIFAEDPKWRLVPRTFATAPAHTPGVLGDALGRLFDVHAVNETRQARPIPPLHLPQYRFGKSQCVEGGPEPDFGPNPGLRSGLPLRDLTFGHGPEGTVVPWAATPFGLWRGTQDRKTSWVRLPLNTNVAAVAIDPHNPDLVYAAAVDGLWRSIDGGAHWRPWGIRTPVFSLALDPGPSELVYTGLAGGRIATVRPGLSGQKPEVASTTLPPRGEKAGGQSQLPVISSVHRLHRDPPPEDAGTAFEQALSATPTTAPHVRALYAVETLRRVGGRKAAKARRALINSLEQILADASSHSREIPVDFGLSPQGRWFFSQWRFHDGLRSHSELRLYSTAQQGWRSDASTTPSQGLSDDLTWIKLHDLTLEPQHLRTSWLFEDPGTCLTWNHNGTRLVSLGGPDQVLLWQVPHHVPEQMARPEEPRVAQLQRGQSPCGAVTALSESGNWLAVAQHHSKEVSSEQTATLTLFQLGRQVEKWTLDVLANSGGEPSPAFTQLLFTGDERHLFGFRADGSAQVWPVRFEGESVSKSLGEHFKSAHRGPRGRWLATVVGTPNQQELQLWPLRESDDFAPILLASGAAISQVRFHEDGSWLSAVVGGSQAHLWDLLAPSAPSEVKNLPQPASSEQGSKAEAESPRETLKPRLAATAQGACTGVFDPHGNWLTHERSAGRAWNLRQPDPKGRLVRAQRPQPKWVSSGGVCPHLAQASQSAGTFLIGPKASHRNLPLWDISQPKPRFLNAQMQRFGPSELHRDEGVLRSSRHILNIWPEKTLNALSDEELRRFTCKLVGRPLTRAEWSFAMGTTAYRPLCLPPAEP